jgi:hypothetical protein
MRLLFIFLSICVAIQSMAQRTTDLEIKGVYGKVAKITDIELTCPGTTGGDLFLQSKPNKKYVTVWTTHVIDAHGNQLELEPLVVIIKRGIDYY